MGWEFKLLLLVGILPTVLIMIIGIISHILSKKKLEEIVDELNLKENEYYEVIVNNGNVYKNLRYTHIGYGNSSQNGRINVYFKRASKYRGTYIDKEIMIKYGNIWKISKLSHGVVRNNDAEACDDLYDDNDTTPNIEK